MCFNRKKKQDSIKKTKIYQPVHYFLAIITSAILFWIISIFGRWLTLHFNFGQNTELINNNDIIFTFIGVIATFIVVTNYSQVQEAKKNVEQKLEDIEKERKKMRKEMNEIRNNVSTLVDFMNLTKIDNNENQSE